MANKIAKRKAATSRTRGKTATKGAKARLCACGCGKPATRTFAQGHDAKARSLILKVQRGELKAADLPATLRTAELAKGDGLIARLLRNLEA